MAANPLKDPQRVRAAMKVAARELVKEVKLRKRTHFRTCDWSQRVLKAMGLSSFAYNDTGARARLHEPDAKRVPRDTLEQPRGGHHQEQAKRSQVLQLYWLQASFICP